MVAYSEILNYAFAEAPLPVSTEPGREMSTEQNHWLLVERLENWEVDQRDRFTQFGLPDSRRILAKQIAKDDLLIFYVSSGVSKFADIRVAMHDGVKKMALRARYDTPFPWRIETKPYLTLEPTQWVPIKELLHLLSITKTKTDWRHVMRQSLRRLSSDDGRLIVQAMQERKKLRGI